MSPFTMIPNQFGSVVFVGKIFPVNISPKKETGWPLSVRARPTGDTYLGIKAGPSGPP